MSTKEIDPNVIRYGYTPVPRDPDVLFANHPTALGPNPKQDSFLVQDIPLPDTALVKEVTEFVKVRIACLVFDA